MENLENNIDLDITNRELCKRIQAGDKEAETELFLANKGLIIRLYQSVGYSFYMDKKMPAVVGIDDLFQIGSIALLRAAYKYNVDSDAKFSSYAYHVIRHDMNKACVKETALDRSLAKNSLTHVYLDEDLQDWDENISDEISVYSHFDPCGELAVHKVMLEKMANRFHNLKEKERGILTCHYGLNSGIEHTWEQTARMTHYTIRYAKRIENGALEKLYVGLMDGKLL